MPESCHKCGTTMLPADDIDCDIATWVCPTCAPDWVLANATTFTDVDDPLMPEAPAR